MSRLEDMFRLDVLIECAVECTKQSRWKETTQRYIANMLQNNITLQIEVLEHRYKVSPTIDFNLNERGKISRIQPQDAMSRHRGAKPPRRCGLLGEISLLSPG